MPTVTQILDETGFSAGAQSLDWGTDAMTGQSIVGMPVSGLPDIYEANGRPVVVNDQGVQAFARDTTSMNVNLPDRSSMLVAIVPPADLLPDAAPIKLKFYTPLREVGAYVTAAGDSDALWKRRLHAILWVRFTGSPNWVASVSANGPMGPVLPHGTPSNAAFVGVRAQGTDTIDAVTFDGTLMGRRPFPYLVLSNLLWVA
ncbi:hypothetical protein MWN34_10065 [Ancylobacter sp. 6x-1]|uniref:Uncharacterized protein n=1 Tax=Ancylobacter crimeensis TaxID=2579147 RepID=A0ABT0DBC8_9HYPH|nr:hypothetical protein [Ancylobacter crimeensis]MCK0197257.1 hypothetical protein [Ancylobacter crimeensis]